MVRKSPTKPGASRSKSEVRQRTVLVAVRLLPDERDLLVAAAAARGVSLSALLRASAIETASAHDKSKT